MTDHGLRNGRVELHRAGPIAFGPDGIVFLADNSSATVYAVGLADSSASVAAEPFDLADVDVRIGSLLGCEAGDVVIADLAVHPDTQNVYVSVQRGRGDAGEAVLVRIDHVDGSMSIVELNDVPMAQVAIADAPAEDDDRLDTTLPLDDRGEELTTRGRTIRLLRLPIRTVTVTSLVYIDGALLVAGLSNEEFSSKLRRVPFPFPDSSDAVIGNNLEIFHVSHGKWETAAPIRAFVPYEGGRSILATYTCTPVVHFPLTELAPGTKTIGRTVAELGRMNEPLDMVAFFQDGQEHLLVANTSAGLIKIDCRDIDAQAPLTEPEEPTGVPFETADVQGITRLANLNDSYVLALQTENEHTNLRSFKTASL